MTGFERIAIILNDNAGQGNDLPPAIFEGFEEQGLVYHVFEATTGDELHQQTQNALEWNADVIVAAGGDGTVAAVAGNTVETDTPLAILPFGTGNVFATELDIPLDLVQAASLLHDGQHQVRQVDVGKVNNHFFLLRVSIGWEAEFVTQASDKAKARAGRAAYLWSALKQWQHTKPVSYKITLDDGTCHDVRGVQMAICNSSNMGLPRLDIFDDILIDDGTIDVVVLGDANIKTVIALVADGLRSLLPGDTPNLARRQIHRWQGAEITIDMEQSQNIVVDGEAFELETPLVIRLLPKALDVVTPNPEKENPTV